MWKQLQDANWKIPYVGGWCEGFVEGSWGQATFPTVNKQITYGVYPSAMAKWNANPGNGNHPGELPPAGVTVPVYFSLGSTPLGHVADSLSDGMVASSTQGGFHTQGYIHKNLQNLIDVYAQYNNGCTYLGWSEYVGNIRVVEPAQVNATDDQIRAAYLEILERPVDDGALVHYRNYTNEFVRQDLYESTEYKTLVANKLAQATAIKAAQEAADARAEADAEAAQKAQEEADARQKVIDAQKEAEAHTTPVQNVPATPTLYDWVVGILKVVGNWLKGWRKA
jgi:hypothetical protein